MGVCRVWASVTWECFVLKAARSRFTDDGYAGNWHARRCILYNTLCTFKTQNPIFFLYELCSETHICCHLIFTTHSTSLRWYGLHGSPFLAMTILCSHPSMRLAVCCYKQTKNSPLLQLLEMLIYPQFSAGALYHDGSFSRVTYDFLFMSHPIHHPTFTKRKLCGSSKISPSKSIEKAGIVFYVLAIYIL